MNIRETAAWKTLIRFTSAEDRRPVRAGMSDAEKLSRVVEVMSDGMVWQKIQHFSPTFVLVVVEGGQESDGNDDFMSIHSGEKVPFFDSPGMPLPPRNTECHPLPFAAIKRVLFAACKPPALMPLYDGVFVDYRNGRVIATDSEVVCSVPIQQQDLDSLWIPYSVARALPAGEYRHYTWQDSYAWIRGVGLSVIYRYTPSPTPPVRILDTPHKGALIICSKKELLSALKKMDNGDGAKTWIEFETGLCWNPAICNDQQNYDPSGAPLGVESLPILHKIGVASNPNEVEGREKAFVSVKKLLQAVRACREGDGVMLESGGESTITLRSGAVETHIGQLRR